MSYCIINRSCIKLSNHKNCQLYKIVHKIVKSFKKLGLGTPPLKKRGIKIVSFVTGHGDLFRHSRWCHTRLLYLPPTFKVTSI